MATGYELITKKEGMGGGDIKLLAMMGAFLGWPAIPFIIFVSSLIGSVIGITVMLIQKKDSKLAIPFGPFLALGAVLYIFFGSQVIHWYYGSQRRYGEMSQSMPRPFRFSLTFALLSSLACLLVLTWILLSLISFKTAEKDLLTQKNEEARVLLAAFISIFPIPSFPVATLRQSPPLPANLPGKRILPGSPW